MLNPSTSSSTANVNSMTRNPVTIGHTYTHQQNIAKKVSEDNVPASPNHLVFVPGSICHLHISLLFSYSDSLELDSNYTNRSADSENKLTFFH